jgi:transposase-like protein
MTNLYSETEKQALLTKLLPPYNLSPLELANEIGITTKTVYNWRKKSRERGLMPSEPRRWSAEQKWVMLTETHTLSHHELSEYCRQKGIYPQDIETWRQECLYGLNPHVEKASSWDKRKIQSLEKELRRKEKALAETAALLVLQKKFNSLWEAEDV